MGHVITLEPVGNRMVDGLLALDGGDAGGAIFELPNNGASMVRCFHQDLFLQSGSRYTGVAFQQVFLIFSGQMTRRCLS